MAGPLKSQENKCWNPDDMLHVGLYAVGGEELLQVHNLGLPQSDAVVTLGDLLFCSSPL